MYPHNIRLRGPWQYRFLEDSKPSGTVEMPSLIGQLNANDPYAAVEFTRSFNWMAKLEPDERIFLTIDRGVGNCTVHLNGQQLATFSSVWGGRHFDVTSLLAGRNQLRLHITPPSPETLGYDPYGKLGFSDDTTQKRSGLAGVLGDVYLSVELENVHVEAPLITATAEPDGGVIRLQTRIDHACQQSVTAGLTLDGHPIAEASPDDAGAVVLQVGNLDISPWQVRDKGLPVLHELTLDFRSAGTTLWQQSWKIGFRAPHLAEELLASPNVGNAFPDRTCRSHAGPLPPTSVNSWMTAGCNLLHVRDHIASEDFYQLCDRTGIALLQDIPLAAVHHGWEDAQALRETLRRLSLHPCVVAMRPTEPPTAQSSPLLEGLPIH